MMRLSNRKNIPVLELWKDVLFFVQHHKPMPIIERLQMRSMVENEVSKTKPKKIIKEKLKKNVTRSGDCVTGKKHMRYYLEGGYSDIFITKRELECLRYYAQCYSIKQAATVMGICYRAAESLIVSMRKKCNCPTAKTLLAHDGLMQLLKNPNPVAKPRRQLTINKQEVVC